MKDCKFTFHHIGIACEDIKKCRDFIKRFMDVKEESDVIFDENQKAEVCLLSLQDGTSLELISGEMVEGLVRKGTYLYHTTYTVENMKRCIRALKKQPGLVIISEPKPAKLFNGKLVAFFSTPIGIIELLEK